jgi:phosphoribosylformylglycinamidine synthase
MTAYEMMLSESQERMLMVPDPAKEEQAEAVFRKWGLDFAIVGKTDATPWRFVVKHQGEVKADLPIMEPRPTRPRSITGRMSPRPQARHRRCFVVPPPLEPGGAAPPHRLRRTCAPSAGCGSRMTHRFSATPCSARRRRGRGRRIGDGPKGLALCTDVTQRYCEADPVQGGRQAVAEAWRNLTAVGATPLALTDNLNFGNPEKPDIHGPVRRPAVRGIRRRRPRLDFPIVSGDVPLQREPRDAAILPTPSIGGVGRMDDVAKAATLSFKARTRPCC